ncbi:MAG: hypothetical protein R3C17_07070 [Planctomycetaceae bacterium]
MLWGDVADQPVGLLKAVNGFTSGIVVVQFWAMCHVVQNGCDWLIRAAKLNRVVQLESGDTTTMEDAISAFTPVGSYELHLRTLPAFPRESHPFRFAQSA